MSTQRFYVCSCFYSRNIFLHKYDMHVVFNNEKQLWKDYGMYLNQRGCKTEGDRKDVIITIETELKRRRGLGDESIKRTDLIREKYQPIHPHVFKLQEKFFATNFLEIVSYCKQLKANKDELLKRLESQIADRVYSFPVFTKEFCQDFLEEIENFESSDLPKGRPNTMNKYGVLLNELGFDEDFMNLFRTEYLQPITTLLFPDWGGDALDSHKAFIVTYKINEDKDLSYHYDNAEVTINISLGGNFSDGQLYFGGMRDVPLENTECSQYMHKAAYGLLHRGQHKHGAMPILEGDRYNLIIWMRSSRVRNQLCPMCDQLPVLVENVGYGDGFTKEVVDVCNTI